MADPLEASFEAWILSNKNLEISIKGSSLLGPYEDATANKSNPNGKAIWTVTLVADGSTTDYVEKHDSADGDSVHENPQDFVSLFGSYGGGEGWWGMLNPKAKEQAASLLAFHRSHTEVNLCKQKCV